MPRSMWNLILRSQWNDFFDLRKLEVTIFYMEIYVISK